MQEDDEKAGFLTKGDHVSISNCFIDLEEGTHDPRLVSFLKREASLRQAVVVIGHDISKDGNLLFFSESDFLVATNQSRLLQNLTKTDPSLRDKIDHLFTISRELEESVSIVLRNPFQNSLAMCNQSGCFEVNKVNTFIQLCDHNHLICKLHLQDEKTQGWHAYLGQIAEQNKHLSQTGTENELSKKKALFGVCSVCNLDPENSQDQILFRTILMQQHAACPLFHTRRPLCSINFQNLQMEIERFSLQEPISSSSSKASADKADQQTNMAPVRVSKETENSNNGHQAQNTYTPLKLASVVELKVSSSSSSSSDAKKNPVVVDLIDEEREQAKALARRHRQRSKDITTNPPVTKSYGKQVTAKMRGKAADDNHNRRKEEEEEEEEEDWDEVDRSKPPTINNKRKARADNSNNNATNKKTPAAKKSKTGKEKVEEMVSDDDENPKVETRKLKSNKKGPIDNWMDPQGVGPVELHEHRQARNSRDYIAEYGSTIATRRRLAKVIDVVYKRGKLMGHIDLVMSEQDDESLEKMDVETLMSLVEIKETEQPDTLPASSPILIDIDAFDKMEEEDQPPSKKKFTGKPIILFVEQPEDMSKGIVQVTVKTDMQYDDVLREVCKKLNFTRKRTLYMLVKVEAEGWNRKIEYERLKSSRKNLWGILDEGELVQVRQVQSAYLGGRYKLSFIASFDRRNRSMKEKIQRLNEDYEGYLEIRGDGNCYYRAVIYGVLEQAVNRQDRRELFYKLHDTLSTVTFTEDEHDIEANHKHLLAAILNAAEGRCWTTLRELESEILMESTGFDQALIVVGKKLVVKYLDEHQDSDWNGITPKIAVMASGQYESFEGYCEAEIMKMGECAEGIHVDIGVLPMLLSAYAEIVMLDRNEDVGILKKGGRDRANGDKARAFSVSLLFRPGHYDLLYKHNELPLYFASSYILPDIDRNQIEEEEEEVEFDPKKKGNVEEADFTDKEQEVPSSSAAAEQMPTPETVLPSTSKRKFYVQSPSTADRHASDQDESEPKTRKRSGSNGTKILSQSEQVDTVPQTINGNASPSY